MKPLSVALIIGNQALWSEVQACLPSLPVRVLFQQPPPDDWALLREQIERLHPDALLVDISRLESLEEPFNRIKSLPAAPMIIALDTSADPAVILAAVRAGAQEFLYPPLEAGLRKALERHSTAQLRRQTHRRQHAHTLAFLSSKGGCGATTVACHVAVELQRLTGQQVLLADFDLDSGLVSFLMKSQSPYSVLDAVQNIHRLDVSYWKALVANGRARLEIIPAPGAATVRRGVDPQPFRSVLQFAQSLYDWVVADFGRNLCDLSMKLLEDVDELFLVSTPDLPALHHAQQVVRALEEAGYSHHRLRLLLNRMPRRSDLTAEEVQDSLGLPVYARLPNHYPELFEAYARGHLLPSSSDLGQQLAALTARIAGLVSPGKSKSTFSM